MTCIKNSWSFIAVSSTRSYTRSEAILLADKYNLTSEVIYLMDNGYSPNEALAEWDLL